MLKYTKSVTFNGNSLIEQGDTTVQVAVLSASINESGTVFVSNTIQNTEL